MELIEYQEIVNETAVYPKEMGLAYTTLGLVGEFQEFCNTQTEKGLLKEFGDVCWYLAASCREIESPFHLTFNPDWKQPVGQMHLGFLREVTINDCNRILGEICEIVKKHYRDENGIDNINLANLYMKFSKNLCDLGRDYGVDIELALQTNYDKLMKRKELNMLKGSGDDREEISA